MLFIMPIMLNTNSQFESIYHSAITLYKHITVTHWLLSFILLFLHFFTKPNLSDPIPLDRWTNKITSISSGALHAAHRPQWSLTKSFLSFLCAFPTHKKEVLEAMHFWSQGRYLTWWQQQNRRLLKMCCGVQRFQTKSKDGFRTES